MQTLRILHLEDDPFFADMVESLLQANGLLVRIRHAENWEGFEAALREGPYDLILSDHQIPGGDGLKALSLCRRDFPAIPFIFLSAMLGEELAIESLKSGAADYVLKSNLSRFIPTVVRTLTAFREAAALKAAEARIRRDRANLHGLIENTTDAIWSMDPDFNVLVFNSAASLLSLKLTGQPMVEGSCLLDRLAPALQASWKDAARRVARGDRFVLELEVEWPGGKGSLEISFHPISDGKQISGMAMSGKDVTERKRIERTIREVEEKRLRLTALYRKIRIPVHGLKRMAGLLERTPLDEGQRRYLGMLRGSVDRISELHEQAEAYESRLREMLPHDEEPEPGPDAEPGVLDHVRPDNVRAKRPKRLAPSFDGIERRQRMIAPLRILVVEDNVVNKIVTLGYLEKLGHAADVAINGHEAVEMHLRSAYDLILMDCQMPVMDGFAAASAIRAVEAKSGGHARIVALTADTTTVTRERCLHSGMEGYLTKPLSLESLKKELDLALEQREQPARKADPGH